MPRLLRAAAAALLALASVGVLAEPERAPLAQVVLASHQILPAAFKPPQVFRHTNLVRSINLDKTYAKESVNVVVENVSKEPQTEYFIPFDAAAIRRVGNVDVRDKKEAGKQPAMRAEVVEYDSASSTQFYRVTLHEPLAPKAQQTLTITYNVLAAQQPHPHEIEQTDKQYLQYIFSEYAHSAYPTAKQKTKLKFPNSDIPDASGKPEKEGTTYTYGPFTDIPAGAESEQAVRYEFTKPLIYASHFERDVEVSHWGGNIAFEERYWLTNRGATLKSHFDRVKWATSQYYNPPTSAIKSLVVPLKPGSSSPYYTDEIGNISTSNFRPGTPKKDARLELKPRYPVFGGWNHPFRIGWDNDLALFLRRTVAGAGGVQAYVLSVPFFEGPKMTEGVSYENVKVRVVLPEGATNIKFQTAIPLVANSTTRHRTFFDTQGRTALELQAHNLADDLRDLPLVITYEYPPTALLRKPFTIFAALVGVFTTAWVLGQIDTSIGRKVTGGKKAT